MDSRVLSSGGSTLHAMDKDKPIDTCSWSNSRSIKSANLRVSAVSDFTISSNTTARKRLKFSENSRKKLPRGMEAHKQRSMTRMSFADVKALQGALESIVSGTTWFEAESSHPWLDSNGSQIFTFRMIVSRMVGSPYFDNIMQIIIAVNLGLTIYETDQEARCYPEYKDDWDSCPTATRNVKWLYITNNCLLALYSVEVVLKLVAQRLLYFMNKWNLLDFTVCLVSWTFPFVAINVQWLRTFRFLRVCSHPLLRRFKVLHMLVKSIDGSMKAIAWGAFLLFGILLFVSIVLVQCIHPGNLEIEYGDCERCSRSYETVLASSLTLFQQIIAGDNWGLLSIPNMERSWIAAIILPLCHLFINLGFMNLILGVIVECAVERREVTKDEALLIKAKQAKERKISLVRTFRSLDVDHNGVLDFDELRDAFHHCNDFKMMMLQSGLKEVDLYDVFRYLDDDGSGEIGYMDLCNALEDITQRDAHVLSALALINVQILGRDLQTRLDEMSACLQSVSSRLEKVPTNRAPDDKSSVDSGELLPTSTSKQCNVADTVGPVRFVSCGSTKRSNGPETSQILRDLQLEVDRHLSQCMHRIRTKLNATLSSLDDQAGTRDGKRSLNSPIGTLPLGTRNRFITSCDSPTGSERACSPRHDSDAPSQYSDRSAVPSRSSSQFVNAIIKPSRPRIFSSEETERRAFALDGNEEFNKIVDKAILPIDLPVTPRNIHGNASQDTDPRLERTPGKANSCII